MMEGDLWEDEGGCEDWGRREMVEIVRVILEKSLLLRSHKTQQNVGFD